MFFNARELKRWFAEFVGTFILVLIHCGLGISLAISQDRRINFMGLATGVGLSIIGLIYAFGNISGAHLNPNISLAFFLGRIISFKRFIFYVFFQFLGAYIAVLVLWAVFGTIGDFGANYPIYLTPIGAAIIEFFCTFIFLSRQFIKTYRNYHRIFVVIFDDIWCKFWCWINEHGSLCSTW